MTAVNLPKYPRRVALHGRQGVVMGEFQAGLTVMGASRVKITGSILGGTLQVGAGSKVLVYGAVDGPGLAVSGDSSVDIIGTLNNPQPRLLAGELRIAGAINSPGHSGPVLPHGTLVNVNSIFNLSTGTWLLTETLFVRLAPDATINLNVGGYRKWNALQNGFEPEILILPLTL